MFNVQRMKWIILPLCLLIVTGLAQQMVQLPEPDLNAFPVPIVKANIKKLAEYPIDTNLTQFHSLKREISMDLLAIGEHVFFADNNTVYRITNSEKRILTFNEPLTRVITDWQTRLFVMTQKQWIFIFDVNTLKLLTKFQVKYDQEISDFVYLPKDIILVGFNLWKDESRKTPHPLAAIAYSPTGKVVWSIKNTAKIFTDFDERRFFEVLQVGTRGFVANCCSFPTQVNSYEGALKTAFIYENKTGKLKLLELSRGTQEPNPPQFTSGTTNPDLYANSKASINISEFKILDARYKFSDVYSHISEKFSKLAPTCDNLFNSMKWNYKRSPDIYSEAIVLLNLLFSDEVLFFSYTLPNICGSVTSGFDVAKKTFFGHEKYISCLNNSIEDFANGTKKIINKILTKNKKLFINLYDSTIIEINDKNSLKTACLWKFDKKYTKEDGSSFIDFKTYKISSKTYGNENWFVSINKDMLTQIILVGSPKTENITQINAYEIDIKGDSLLMVNNFLYSNSGRKISIYGVKK